MPVSVQAFGRTREGKPASLYTITNANGMSAVVSDYGAILVRLLVPCPDGVTRDLVLGYDTLEEYERGGFFGATVGRNANRIAGAAFTLDGVEYPLSDNDGGCNLHTDFKVGFHKQLWNAELLPDGVRFSRLSPDGEGGFPGNLQIAVSYTLLPDNSLVLRYEGVSDRKTLINLTNHSFFHLAGHDAGSVEDEVLTLFADRFVEIGPGKLPTGRILPVSGTPLDFRRPKRIGQDIDRDWEQLRLGWGYDHCYCLDTTPGTPSLAARVEEPRTGLILEMLTDQPGVQFYTANALKPQLGKGGAAYGRRCALCLEAGLYPDGIHHPTFPQPVFAAGEPYRAVTIYRFR